jgi:hypothetical protein
VGRRGLVLRLTRAPDYGRYRIFLDDEPISSLSDYPDWNPRAPFDFYGPTVDTRDLYLGTYELSPGKHTLRFEGAGQNTASTGNYLGLDSIRFRQRWDRKRPSLRGDDY